MAAAAVLKDIPASGWVVGGLLVAGAGFLAYRSITGLVGAIPGAIGDAAGAAADLAGDAVDEFVDLGSAAKDVAGDVGTAAVKEAEDLGRFLGAVGSTADTKVSEAVDNAISDLRTSAVVVQANKTKRKAKKKARKVLGRGRKALRRGRRRLRL